MSEHRLWHAHMVPLKNRLVAGVEYAAARDGFALDSAQRELLDRLATLGTELDRGVLRRSSPRSLYIYGDAGRGKSWLADAFYAELTSAQKTRVHFHGFFDDLHRRIHHYQGEDEAINLAIDDITQGSRLLYFDELHVHDPGDARLLTRLLDRVFQQGITVLATSNYAPENLLPNPIWHHIFTPGISLITTNMDAWRLRGPTDYRSVNTEHSHGFAAGTWSVSATDAPPAGRHAVTVNSRDFTVTATDDNNGILTATFDQLCVAATSPIEYLHWARTYPRWAITHVPAFSDADPGAQQRFINLIDVLVNADVTVNFSSSVELSEFLADASGRPDTFRMVSRLHLVDSSPRSAG